MVIGITGGRGFVGSHVVKKLKEINHKVFYIRRNKHNNRYILDNKFQFDWIFHFGALLPDKTNKSSMYFESNVNTTLQLIEYIKEKKIKLLYLSSYVYGNPNYLPVDEKHEINPTNSYSESKYICERILTQYSNLYNLQIIILRPFNIYGKNQSTSFLIPKIMEGIKKGKLTLNDPNPKRDFIYINDVIDLITQIIEKNLPGCNKFNMGSGTSISVHDLFKIISKLMKTKPKINYTNVKRNDEILDLFADMKKTTSHFNWKPKFSIEDGIKDMLNE